MPICLQKDSQNRETITEYVLMLALIFLIVIFARFTVGERTSSAFSIFSNAVADFVR